ncbi:MAG: hypothetical protein JXR83_08900 [Deltaproteobacteria bacterium]|nr:hypothetical protein [Deltaproteobacteria bacterium]
MKAHTRLLGGVAIAVALAGVVLLDTGCSRERAKREAKRRVFAPPPPDPVVTRAGEKIEVGGLANQPAVRDRLVHMSAAEIGQRLGSFVFEAEGRISFSRGTVKRHSTERAALEQAANGDFRLDLAMEGGDQQHLVYSGGVLYVRHNYGVWRASRDPTDERLRWREQAYGIWPSFYDLFGAQIRFVEGTPTTREGRPVVSFTISVTAGKPPAEQLAKPSGEGTEGERALARRAEEWRRYTVAESGGGTLVLDERQAVPLEVDFGGTLRVVDDEQTPAQLEVAVKAKLGKIGSLERIEPPADYVQEYVRRKIVTDPLAFLGAGASAASSAPDKDQAGAASAGPAAGPDPEQSDEEP